jgi:hypothetical protein
LPVEKGYEMILIQEEEDDIESDVEEEVERTKDSKPISPTDWHKAGPPSFFYVY